MIELLGWIGLSAAFAMTIYHRYMYSNYEQVYQYINKKYGDDTNNIEFSSKDNHLQDAKKYSYYTAFFAVVLIIINMYFR